MSDDDKMKDIFGEESEESEQEDNNEEAHAHDSKQKGDGSDNDDSDNQSGSAAKHSENSDNEENVEGNQSADASEAEQENASANEGSDVDDNIKPKKAKTVDVFGDDLDDLSGESGNEETEDIDDSTARNKTDEIEEVEEPEKLINVDIGRVKADLGKEVHLVKLPNFLSVEPKPFDPEFYEDEGAETDELDEEGNTRVKLKVENTIRWRYAKDEEGNTIKESNSKMVRWSDGSLSMHLGNEIFDVTKPVIQGDHNHFFIRQGTCLLGQAVFKTKLTFRPHSTDSLTHRKMTMSIVDRGSKLQKVKILSEAVLKNPEENRAQMMRKEEEKLRAASRRENQQRRIREKNYSKQISSSYLEDKYSDEDESISLSAIKSKFKDGKKEGRPSIYSSGDESDRERRLNKAKLSDNDSDDGAKMASKKKKKLVADDDE